MRPSQFVRHSVTAARNKAGFEALTTYELARCVAKRPENAGLRPHVADMRRALGRIAGCEGEEAGDEDAAGSDAAADEDGVGAELSR